MKSMKIQSMKIYEKYTSGDSGASDETQLNFSFGWLGTVSYTFSLPPSPSTLHHHHHHHHHDPLSPSPSSTMVRLEFQGTLRPSF